MQGRSYEGDTSLGYRFGFNGQEKDDELYGDGNNCSSESWQYDTRLGRRWNIDPLTYKYPWQSPYLTFDGNPIRFIDFNGKEAKEAPIRAVKEMKKGNYNIIDLEKNFVYSKDDNKIDVFAHGNYKFMIMEVEDVNKKITKIKIDNPESFNKYMKENSPAYKEAMEKGETFTVTLHSCNTGANTDKEGNPVIPIGQKISDEYPNLIVIAPDGKCVTGDKKPNENGGAYEKGIVDKFEKGSYRTFFNGKVINTDYSKGSQNKKSTNKDPKETQDDKKDKVPSCGN